MIQLITRTDERNSLPVFLLGGIPVDPVYAVSPVIAFLSESIGHIVDRVAVRGTYSLVACAQQNDKQQKKE